MESSPEPSAESFSEAPPETDESSSASDEDNKSELLRLAQAASTARLSPADEEKMTRLAKGCLLGGRTGVATIIEALPMMPWILGVRAVEAAWPELTSGFRTQLLSGLAKDESDGSRRIRLSIARSLARIELPVALKVAGGVCKEIWDKETGALSAENSKIIGNVFIGRGKPWVLQLPLAELKPAEADALVHCVVASAFNINNPPITQLSILRYASQDGRLSKLHENVLALVIKGVGRWNAKWQAALRKDVPELPEVIAAALQAPAAPEPQARPERAERPERGGRGERGGRNERQEREPRPARQETPKAESHRDEPQEEAEIPLPPELEEKLQLAYETGDTEVIEGVTKEVNAWRETQRQHTEAESQHEAGDEDDEDDDEDEDEKREREEAGSHRGGRDRNDRGGNRGGKKERPVYVSREEARGGGGSFNLNATLKQIENHCQQLRSELSATQNRLRRAEDTRNRKPAPDRPIASVEDANLSPDELRRLNIQLEGRITELQARVEELTTDSEARAVSMDAGTDQAPPDAVTQLRTLLAIKLQEDYADFVALDNEAPDFVVQQHYRDLIRHVFGVLAEEGVALKLPTASETPI